MKTTMTIGFSRHWPAYLTMLLVWFLTLYGCGSGNTAGQMAQTSSPLSSTETPVATPTLSGPDFDATKIAAIDAPLHELGTRVASGTPFVMTPIPIPTQNPVLTPILGITGNCAQGNHQFDY